MTLLLGRLLASACSCLSANRQRRSASSASRRSATPATRFRSSARSKTPGRARSSRGSSARPSIRCSRGLEGVEFVVLDKARGLRGYAAVHRALGRQTFRCAAAHACVGAREHREPARPLAVADRLRSRARSRSAMAVHEHEAARATRASRHGRPVRVRRADRRAATAKPRWDFPIGADDVAAIAPLFANGKPTLVISPCTGQRFRNYRNWRVDWYAEIADYAAQRYGAQVLAHGRHHGDRAELRPRHRRPRPASRPTNLIGKTTLKQLLAILAARRASCSAPTRARRTWRRPSARRSSACTRPRIAIARAPTSASTSSSTSIPRPSRASSAGRSRRCAGASASATRPP